MKNFRIPGRVRFRFVDNWIDATNTPQRYGSTGTCDTASKSCFGRFADRQTQSNYPRQVQLAGRITF